MIGELANSVGSFIEYWGFKAIDGRVWSLIFLSEEPISTPEIVSTLGVSKGLVSIAINELIEYELIIPKNKVKHGAQTYIANENVVNAIQSILKNRELKKIKETEHCLKSLINLSTHELSQLNISNQKLKKLSQLTKLNKKILQVIIAKKSETIDDWISMLNIYKRFI